MVLQELPRRERRKIKRKEELLEEAKIVFSEKGFLSTSIEDIADQADIAVGSVYNFFKNKDDLYIQVVETIFQESLKSFETITTALEQTTLKEALKKIVSLKLGFFFKYKSFSLGVMEAVSGGIFAREEGFKKVCLAFKETVFQKIFQILNSFQKQLKGFNLNYLTFTLEGTISDCIHHLAHQKTEKKPEQIIEELSLHFFKMLGLENIAKDTKGRIKIGIKSQEEQKAGLKSE